MPLPDGLVLEQKVCEMNVAVPTMRVVRFTPESDEWEAKHEIVDPESSSFEFESSQRLQVAVQWFGEAEGTDLGERQFLFTLSVRFDHPCWMGHPEKFRVIFLGPVGRWTNPRAVPDLVRDVTAGNPDGLVLWVASSHYTTLHSNGEGPACFALHFNILLADGVVGVIRPRFYLDMSVLERLNSEVAGMSRD